MKLLLFYGPRFRFATFRKALESVPDDVRDVTVEDAVIVFVHAEAEDAPRIGEVATRLIKNAKWLAGKFGARNVVLHYFSHLSASTAPAEVAQEILERARERLAKVGYRVEVTPFGHFCSFELHVAGESLAKVFTSF
jgi:hypothetical protein